MNQDMVNRYRRELSPRLTSYLRAENVPVDQTRLRCPRCEGLALLDSFPNGERRTATGPDWHCAKCGALGDTVDYAMALYPCFDEGEAILHIHRMLGMKFKELDVISAGELMDLELPPQRYLIERLLGPGCYLLVGGSKTGKSWLALSLALSVARGEDILGLKTERGEVLYLSLEDSYQNLQQRLDILRAQGQERLWLCNRSELLGEGLEDGLETFLREHGETRLIIVDTLQLVRPQGDDKFSYGADYKLIGRFKSLADRHGLTVLLLHHTRKMEATDAFDRVSGTTGLMGAADGTLLLERERGSREATLRATSRKMPELNLKLRQDEDTMLWQLVEELDGTPPRRHDPLLRELAALVREKGGWQGSCSELLAALPEAVRGELTASTLSRRLNANVGTLEQEYGVRMGRKKLGDGSKRLRLWAA